MNPPVTFCEQAGSLHPLEWQLEESEWGKLLVGYGDVHGDRRYICSHCYSTLDTLDDSSFICPRHGVALRGREHAPGCRRSFCAVKSSPS
jgi:hypothetical protein